MFVILTNVASLTSKELIIISRARDTCEKSFKRIKNHFDLARPLIHNDQTYKGKMFIAICGISYSRDI